MLTNVTNPRAEVDRQKLYETTIIRGATIGANATILCGITLGRYCFLPRRSLCAAFKMFQITRSWWDHPRAASGWMSRHGHVLQPSNGTDLLVCPESGLSYKETPLGLRCIDLDEESFLPKQLCSGEKNYREIKNQKSIEGVK